MLANLQLILVYTFVFGSIYLLVSLGFSLVCGVVRIFNLGYGMVFLIAIYGTWFFIDMFGWGLWPAILGMVVIQVIFTLGVLYFPIVKPHLEREEVLLTMVILLAMIVEETVNFKYPESTGIFLSTTIIPGTIKIAGASVPMQMITTGVAAVIITAVFVLFLMYSRIGLKIRALSQNTRIARLMGTNVDSIYSVAMLISVIPPTIAALLIVPFWAVDPMMGWPLLQTSILVAILGGLGNIRGSILASYIVGFVSSAVAFIIDPRLMGLAVLIMVLVVLLFRPQGIARSESLW